MYYINLIYRLCTSLYTSNMWSVLYDRGRRVQLHSKTKPDCSYSIPVCRILGLGLETPHAMLTGYILRFHMKLGM